MYIRLYAGVDAVLLRPYLYCLQYLLAHPRVGRFSRLAANNVDYVDLFMLLSHTIKQTVIIQLGYMRYTATTVHHIPLSSNASFY